MSGFMERDIDKEGDKQRQNKEYAAYQLLVRKQSLADKRAAKHSRKAIDRTDNNSAEFLHDR